MKRIEAQKAYFLCLCLLMLSVVMMLQGCSNSKGEIGGGHWNEPLVSLAVTPKTASIPVRGTQQFTATAT